MKYITLLIALSSILLPLPAQEILNSINTADSEHYGRMHIIMFDSKSEILEFTWAYLGE